MPNKDYGGSDNAHVIAVEHSTKRGNERNSGKKAMIYVRLATAMEHQACVHLRLMISYSLL